MTRLTLTRPVTDHTPTTNFRTTLLVAAAGTFAALLAYTGPLGNLPTVAHALHAGPAAQTWILSSMSVALAAAVLTVGALADDHGRRLTFVIGSVVLAAGSVLCALAGHTAVFFVGRLTEGAGAAAVIAAGLGLVAEVATTPAQRASASGMWGASVGAGIALGPVATGLLDEVHLWRAFYVLLAVGSLALAAVTRSRAAESVAAAPGRPTSPAPPPSAARSCSH